jgi:hypothetical protein
MEVLASYSHSTQDADLLLRAKVALTGPLPTPEPSARRPWRLRDRLNECDITDLITAYREGATAASLATDHGLSPRVSNASCTSPVSAGGHPLSDLRRQHRPRQSSARPCPAFTAHSGRRVHRLPLGSWFGRDHLGQGWSAAKVAEEPVTLSDVAKT